MIVFIRVHSDRGSMGERIEIENLLELKKRTYWEDFYKEGMLKASTELAEQLENLYQGYRMVTFEHESSKIGRYGAYLKDLFKAGQFMFIPEFLELTDEEINGLESSDRDPLEINIYHSEFEFRTSMRRLIFSIYRMNKNIHQEKRLKELLDGNSKVVRNISKNDLDYIISFLDNDSFTFSPKELNLITEEDSMDPLHGILHKLKEGEKHVLKRNSNATELDDTCEIEAIKCFGGRPLEYSTQNGFLVNYGLGNYLYYESGYVGYNLIVIMTPSGIKSFVMSCWGDFIKYIDNFEKIFAVMDKLPKHEVMDEEYKSKFINFLSKR